MPQRHRSSVAGPELILLDHHLNPVGEGGSHVVGTVSHHHQRPVGLGAEEAVAVALDHVQPGLARVTVPRPDGAQGMPGVIIPRKCVGELRKLLDGEGRALHVDYVMNNNFAFGGVNTSMVFKRWK